MSIAEQLRSELKDAMRGRDQPRIDVIRQVETEVSVAKSAPGFKGEIDDALYLQVIAAYSKKMSKAVKEYEELGERGAEMAAKLRYEVEYLSRWLPKTLGEAETRALVKEAIASLGVSGAAAVGRVMGQIMKQRREGLDATLVNRIVREELG